MLDHLLQTKLFAPRLRPSLIPRPRLTARLNQGVQHGSKLTLISAPAGFGKTTVVSEWMAAGARPFAWLSLDERDGDLKRFLTYFIAALQTIAPTSGKKVVPLIESAQSLPTESILTILLNEIASMPAELTLVLDDYHAVDAQAIDQALTFLLDHLPPQMHLIITTREDPPLPLSRLRVRGWLTELRAEDLRFTAQETAAFLQRMMGLNLSAAEITALETRTEGWIAGLQMAALSMQGRADVHQFIQAFAGDNRYIMDYLVDEVLAHQPRHIREFLLETSILEELNSSLCEAVTGQTGGAGTLETLERSNLFLIPLDDRRQWYRYHQLFAGVLQAHLLQEQPEGIDTLHRRASEWYERHGIIAAAVRHALAGKDFERAAVILEQVWAEMDQSRQSTSWLGWAKMLPEDLVTARPVLSVGCAWALLDSGELEAAEARLRDAEQWLKARSALQETPPAPNVIVDEAEFRALPGTIASARTYLALALGDMDNTMKYARQALKLLPEEDHLRRGTPAALLGLATWATGDLPAAVKSFSEAMDSYRLAGNTLFVITGAYVLAEMKTAQGRLRDAQRTAEQSVRLAWEQGEPVLRGAADLYTGLSELSLEQNNLPAAKEYLRQSQELGQEIDLPRWHFRWCIAQARVKEAEGALDEALALLDEAERHYVRGPVPDGRPLAALKARVWVAQGRLAQAQEWSGQQELSAGDELNYLREFEHMTLARIRIAQYRQNQEENALHEAAELLARLLPAAEAGGRMGVVIEALILQALAHQAQGRMPLALDALARALALAEPEGYVRIFAAEGPPMAQLLLVMVGQGLDNDYTNNLLATCAQQDGPTGKPAASYLAPPPSQPLLEPLSERELEVLQLLAQGLSNREIGERLFIALPTVKGHNRNIYGKLQVKRRTEAIARARELGLLRFLQQKDENLH